MIGTTKRILVANNFWIWDKDVSKLTDEKILILSNAHVLRPNGSFNSDLIKIKKNRIEPISGEYGIDLVLEDLQGYILDVRRIAVTVRAWKEFVMLIIYLFIFLVIFGAGWLAIYW